LIRINKKLAQNKMLQVTAKGVILFPLSVSFVGILCRYPLPAGEFFVQESNKMKFQHKKFSCEVDVFKNDQDLMVRFYNKKLEH